MKFPLGQDVHDSSDVLNMISSLLTNKFTMGEQVSSFEKTFAKYVGSKHAVMVNSGSSANLLAFSALINHKSNRLKSGHEVLVPAVCWSTSVFPIIQSGLVPVFVDTDPNTLNIDLADVERKITYSTKAIMLVHVLGNCADMEKLMSLVKKYHLVLIEDTCESLGSKYNNQYLGSFGDFGTYSFYYSHHITTIEGGMVVCNNDDDYEILKCLRAHGWSRSHLHKDKIEEQYPDLDSRFTFINLGYNVRPMEIQAAMGIGQLNKLEAKNNNRIINYNKLKEKILNDSRGGFISFPSASKNASLAWFGVAFFIDEDINLKDYLDYLTKKGVENRPIITGNMVRQPVMIDLYPHLNPLDYPGAERCHFHGLFIGLSSAIMPDELIEELADIILSYKK